MLSPHFLLPMLGEDPVPAVNSLLVEEVPVVPGLVLSAGAGDDDVFFLVVEEPGEALPLSRPSRFMLWVGVVPVFFFLALVLSLVAEPYTEGVVGLELFFSFLPAPEDRGQHAVSITHAH